VVYHYTSLQQQKSILASQSVLRAGQEGLLQGCRTAHAMHEWLPDGASCIKRLHNGPTE
jgi:hypothetical protein